MKRRLHTRVVLTLVLVAGCGDATGPRDTDVVASIELSPATQDLTVGQSRQFGATLRTADDRIITGVPVAWTIVDGSIASVSGSGMVTALKVGTTKVRAASQGQAGVATLRVLEAGRPAVGSVSVSPPGHAMVEGTSHQFAAEVRSTAGSVLLDRIVTWRSGADAVARVSDSGLVTAVGEGTTRITATSEGTEGWTEVTVTADPGTGGVVVRVELDRSDLDLDEGEAVALQARAFDAEGREITGRVTQWTSDRVDVAPVTTGGVVTALRPGVASVTARVDGASTSAAIRVTASYDYDIVYDGWQGVAGVAPEIYVLDLRNPDPAPLPTFPAGRQARDPTASPDGTRIAFVLAVGGGSQIWVANRDGSDARALTSGSGFNDQPAWSPDGSRIAYRAWPSGQDSDIWTVDASDGSDARNLTADLGSTNQAYPAWSPDLGGWYRIAFNHSSAGQGHIYTMNEDGSNKVPATTPTGSYDDQPAWSADGLLIAFIRASPGIGSDLWVTSPSGGARLVRQLANSQLAPAWSPDGRPVIAFVSRHDGQSAYSIYTIWADGSRIARRTYDAIDAQNVGWIRR